jgi:molybdate transport system substrate-binding protein
LANNSLFLTLKMLKTYFFFFLWLIFSHNITAQKPIRVAVAASLAEPMQQVSKLYEAQYKVKIELIVAASGALAAQVRNGAPFDLFFSADNDYPAELVKTGFGIGPPKVLVRGQVVLWAKAGLAGISAQQVLASPGIKRLALPQPGIAPHGTAAQAWLAKQQLLAGLQAKLVYGENVGKVNQYISSGSVQAAFTAASAQYLPALKGKGRWLPLDLPPIPHGAIILRGRDRPEVLAFFAWLASPQAAKVFAKYGYLPGE